MSKAYTNAFVELSVELPCCKETSSLNALLYNSPCGFACLEFNILNPTNSITSDNLKEIDAILDTKVKLIYSHI